MKPTLTIQFDSFQELAEFVTLHIQGLSLICKQPPDMREMEKAADKPKMLEKKGKYFTKKSGKPSGVWIKLKTVEYRENQEQLSIRLLSKLNKTASVPLSLIDDIMKLIPVKASDIAGLNPIARVIVFKYIAEHPNYSEKVILTAGGSGRPYKLKPRGFGNPQSSSDLQKQYKEIGKGSKYTLFCLRHPDFELDPDRMCRYEDCVENENPCDLKMELMREGKEVICSPPKADQSEATIVEEEVDVNED